MTMTLRTILASLIAALALIVPRVALAGDSCRTVAFEGMPVTYCTARAGEDVRMWLRDPKGRTIGAPGRVADLLAPGEKLAFAMNAGMFHPDRTPVGLYIENGEEKAPLLRHASGGNFGLLPNGVFCVEKDRFRVMETEAYAAHPPACRYATQSGPMLLIDGDLHPRFLKDGDSLNIRNGVGVSADGRTAWFAISDKPLNFHRFARFFRDTLGARNALYFDGSVSRLTVPGAGRSDFGFPVGPIVGLVARTADDSGDTPPAH